MLNEKKHSLRAVVMAMGFTVLTGLAGCSDDTPMAPTAEERAAVVARIKPVVTLDDLMVKKAPVPAPAAAPAMEASSAASESMAAPQPAVSSAKPMYDKACMACHSTGAAGAPMLGDKAAWEPRYAAGIDAMLTTAKTGKGAMPPNGASTYSEAEMRQVIEFMLTEAGLI